MQMYTILGISYEEEWQKQTHLSFVATKHGYCDINALLFLTEGSPESDWDSQSYVHSH